MPMRTDHGLLVVHDEADGTMSLSICAKVVGGKPTDIYAQYFHAKQVNIDHDVALTRLGRLRYTDEIVEVSSRIDGVVSVRHPRYDDQPSEAGR